MDNDLGIPRSYPDTITYSYIRGVDVISPNEYKVGFLGLLRVLLGRFGLHPGGRTSRSPAINTKARYRLMRGIEQRCRRISMLRLLRLQGQQTSILDTLQIFRLTECQHPRDKVYAPLGLAPVPAKRSIMVAVSCRCVLERSKVFNYRPRPRIGLSSICGEAKRTNCSYLIKATLGEFGVLDFQLGYRYGRLSTS